MPYNSRKYVFKILFTTQCLPVCPSVHPFLCLTLIYLYSLLANCMSLRKRDGQINPFLHRGSPLVNKIFWR